MNGESILVASRASRCLIAWIHDQRAILITMVVRRVDVHTDPFRSLTRSHLAGGAGGGGFVGGGANGSPYGSQTSPGNAKVSQRNMHDFVSPVIDAE